MEYQTFTHPEFGNLRAILIADEAFFCLADALQCLHVEIVPHKLYATGRN